MNIPGTILSKILGKPAETTTSSPAAATIPPQPASESAASIPSEAAAPPAPAPEPVDIEAILSDLASKHPEKLDWKKSIVDLMKLVGMDSSLSARKDLARELGYEGDTSDSAKMNVWLHKQVLRKLAENGGKVPAELLD